MPVPHTGHPPQRTTPPTGQPIRPHQPQPRLPPAVLPAPCRTPSRLASPDTAEARDVCLGHPRSHMRIVGCRADASRGAPAMRATRGAPTDEQPRDSSDMQGQPALSRPRSYPATTGSVSARRYAARARRDRQSKIGQRRITRGLLPRSHSVTCTDSMADRTGSADCTGISRPPVPRPVPRPAVDRRSPPHYHADSAAPLPGMNAGQPFVGYERYDVRLSCLE